jgi:hypothetical protein
MSAVPISRVLIEFGKGSSRPMSTPLLPPPLSNLEETSLEESFAEPLLVEEPKEDPTQLIEEAYARGVAESRATAEQEFVRKLLDLRIHADAQAAQERAKWATEEGARLAEQIRTAFAELEIALAEGLERVIKPFVTLALRQQMVSALKEELASLLSDERQYAVKISGPEDLLKALAAGLASGSRAVEFVPKEGVDVVVVADATTIQTRLADWLAQFDAMVQ